jgi:hypothetical protein
MTVPNAFAALAVCALTLVATRAVAQGTGAATQQPPPAAAQAAAAPPATSTMPADLSGHWELNVQQSERPGQAAGAPGEGGEGRGGYGGGGRGGYGGGGGRGGFGGMGGRHGGYGGGGRGSGGESETTREQMRQVMQAARTLLIVQHANDLSITDDEGRVVTLKPDGNKVKEQQGGGNLERKTKWDGRSLVTEMKLEGGTKVTQTYTKVDEGLQLIVSTKVEGGRIPRAMEFKRVYDQALQSK